jgi:hypothetical protein
MLADVDAGSDTPSLVGKVLKWRRDHPDEGPHISSLRPVYYFIAAVQPRASGPRSTNGIGPWQVPS